MPGQILPFTGPDGSPVYLALASDPGAPEWELLASDDAIHDIKLVPGQTLDLPEPVGCGFDPAHAAGRDVVLFGVGSALGPLRPLIRALLADRSNYGWVRLYAGVRSREHVPFADEMEAWRRERVDVFVCLSKPWVQDVFRRDPPDLSDAVAYVCGMEGMLTGVTAALGDAGLPAERVFRNY